LPEFEFEEEKKGKRSRDMDDPSVGAAVFKRFKSKHF
jgi:hypothetical protein